MWSQQNRPLRQRGTRERALSTWMVVEDEPDIYEVLLAMFEMWGIEGVAFVDGEEAVAWIEEVDKGKFSGELPELALLDIRLPGLVSGMMVGERIRKSTLLQHMAIVLITAWKLSADEEKQVIEKAGADRLISKPLPRFPELKQLLEDLIAQRRQNSQQAPPVPSTPSGSSTPPSSAPSTPPAATPPVTPSSTSTPPPPVSPASTVPPLTPSAGAADDTQTLPTSSPPAVSPPAPSNAQPPPLPTPPAESSVPEPPESASKPSEPVETESTAKEPTENK